MWKTFTGAVGAILVGIITNELYDRAGGLARWAVRYAARLWTKDVERQAIYHEAWLNVLQERPGNLRRLCTALCFLAGACVQRGRSVLEPPQLRLALSSGLGFAMGAFWTLLGIDALRFDLMYSWPLDVRYGINDGMGMMFHLGGWLNDACELVHAFSAAGMGFLLALATLAFARRRWHSTARLVRRLIFAVFINGAGGALGGVAGFMSEGTSPHPTYGLCVLMTCWGVSMLLAAAIGLRRLPHSAMVHALKATANE